MEQQLRSQLEKYAGYLTQDPENIHLICQVADLHLRLGEKDIARNILESELKKRPNDHALRFNLSNVAMASSQFDEAVDLLDGLLSEGVTAPAVRYNYAYALAFKGDYETAKDQLLTIKGNEDVPKSSLLLGRMYHHLGDLENGIFSVTDYLKKHPEDNEASGVLSMMFLDDEKMDEAMKWAEVALETDSSQLEALVTAGTVSIARNEIENAQQYFQHAVESKPTSGRAWAGKGLTTMLDLDIPLAIENLKKAVQFMPTHIGTWHTLAWCYIVQEEFQKARECFDKSMEIDNRFGETYGGLAVVSILENKLDEVDGLITKAKRLDSASFSAYFAQSLLAQHRGHPERATKIIKGIFESLNSLENVDFANLLNKVMKKDISRH